jgi:cytochrome c-type biogenesis protein CcmF
MIGLLGHFVVVIAFVTAALGSLASFIGARAHLPALRSFGKLAAFWVFTLLVIAVGLMEYALLGHDFSVKYVAEVGSRETPLYYTVISLWAALDGSILFWALLLSLYTVVFLLLYRKDLPRPTHAGAYGMQPAAPALDLQPDVTAVLLGLSAFFLFLLAGPGNPFARQSPVPADGPGPNPLLQNHPMMGLHPPLLYLGYVGLSVPFALAMAALLRGAPGADALRLLRRWALVPWVCLSLGIVAGMWWSYAVLGWGGYWSWDPVENASVMPWLVTTAFLHSLQVQERRQMLKAWTLTLVVSAFLLSLLGTFLTRSGVLVSVHSFTQSAIGPVFLGFLALVLVGSVGLLLTRSRELAAPGTLDATVCREVAFLLNNLLLVAITVTVLLGTLFPLLAEAVGGTQLSVGAPYFNQVAVPLGLALLFLLGIGPALPWGAARPEELQYRFLLPVGVGVGLILVLLGLGVRGIGPLVTFGAAAFVLTVTLEQVGSDLRARRRSSGEGWSGAARRLVAAHPRRYGGYLAHVGVLVVVVGIAASQAYQVRALATLRPGQSMALAGYTLTYKGLRPTLEANRLVLAAAVTARRGSQRLGTLLPSQNYYPGVPDPVVTPAVREEPWELAWGLVQGHTPLPDLGQLLGGRNPFEDLYLVLNGVAAQHGKQPLGTRSIALQAVVTPLVGLIWLGGMVVGLGGVVALLPARRRRRVAEREHPAGDAARPQLQPEEVRA